jgi:hypothetical protein
VHQFFHVFIYQIKKKKKVKKGGGDQAGPVCFCVSKALLTKFENFLFFY